MKHFPAICIDNFYKNPDWVRKFALSLPYDNPEDKDGRYPGKRTIPLHEIDKKFFEDFTSKVFSVLYDFKNPVNWVVSSTFQLIEPYQDQNKNEGWIHTDDDCLFAGVLYLTPDADPNSGTSIYRLKEGRKQEDGKHDWLKIKTDFYSGKNQYQYENLLQIHNDNFEETIRFSNIYNRMILFDATSFHGVKTFNCGNEPRLTQVFFVKNLNTPCGTPLERCRNQNYL